MGALDCEAFVKGIVGNKLTDEELEVAFKKYDDLRIKFVNEGKTDNIEKRIANAIAFDAQMRKYRKAKARQTYITNVTKFREMNDFIAMMEAHGYRPDQAIKIKMEGGQGNEFGVRDHVDVKKNSMANEWLGGMFAEAVETDPAILTMIRQDPKFDDAFGQELGELNSGGTPGSTGNSYAQRFAQIAKRWSETARLAYNSKGGMKPAPDGYVDLSHNSNRMVKAGKEKWVNFLYDLIDKERTFQGIDPNNMNEIKEIMRRDFDRKVTGRHFGETIAAPTFKASPSSLIDRFSTDGTYFFKGFKEQDQYQKAFGHGSYVSSVLHQMTQMSRATAMMDVFGPNPEIFIKQLISHHQERLGREATNITDPKELAKIHKKIAELKYERLEGHINEMTGTAAIPVHVSFANLNSGIRGIMAMGKMSNLIVSSAIGDNFNMAANNIYGGQKGLDAFAPFLRMFENVDPNQRKIITYRLGEGLQGFIGSLYADVIDTGPMNGGMAKTMNNFFKWIGVTGMFDHSRQAFVRERAAWLGINKDKTFDQLDPFLQKGLFRNGIDADRWDAIRNGQTEALNGSHYVMPESVRTVDDKYILKLVEPRLKEAYQLSKADEAKMEITKQKRIKAFEKRRDEIIDEMRYDVEMKLRQYYADETNHAVVQPNAKSRRISRGAVFGDVGTRPGTPFGEALRSVFMFKSFSIVNWDNLARAVENRNVLAMGAQGAGILARLIAFQVVAGYAIEYVKDIAKGHWPPKVPWDKDLATRALSTGGSMGMYGDYLTSLVNAYDTPSGILGPELEYAYKTGKFVLHDLPFNKKGRTAEALQLALDVTPFGNLMVARPIIDTIILDELREWSSPGYKRRKAKKLKEGGQRNLYNEVFR